MVNLLLAAVTTLSLNGTWSFTHDVEGRTAWCDVEVPHDWAIAGPFDPDGECRTGKLPWKGKGRYRRMFVVPDNGWESACLWFGGAMCWPQVKVNGVDVGGWDYGYASFRVDVTKALRQGTNTVEVSLDTAPLKARFYPGAGLYRDVELALYGAEEHLVPDSVFITTPDVSAESAKVVVTYETTRGPGRKEFVVENPRLWDVSDPHLYELELFGERFRYGIRTAEFTADDGFHLNGRRVQLYGVDLHADMGPLGMAFNRSVMKRQLSIMKDMGVNALRTSHNACDPQVLELCDEMGIVVWNECFDKWDGTAGRRPEQDLEEYVSRNLRAFARRDRNHPSVVVWSIGNEITPNGYDWNGKSPNSTNGMSAVRFRQFRAAIREFDTTRPVGIGCCHANAIETGMFAELDLTGWNYKRQYARVKAKHPDKPTVYSESASALSSYGFFSMPPSPYKTAFNVPEREVDGYDHNAAPWSDIPDIEFWRMEKDRYCAGEFVWTGIDYLGEPTPYIHSNSFPMMKDVPKRELARSSYFGIVDLMGVPKDRFWLYRSHWNKKDETVHILPHWNWNRPSPHQAPGTKHQAPTIVPVYVYTSGDSAELFLNGKSLGKRAKETDADYPLDDQKEWNKPCGDFRTNGYYRVCDRYRLRWLDVPYEPGELKVVAYRSGKKIGEQVMRTAEYPRAVKLTPEAKVLPADGETCVFVQVDLVDEKGTRDPWAENRVSFKIEGPGKILAVGNGDPRGLEPFTVVSSHPLYFGKAVAVVRRNKDATGPIRLTASVEGLTPATVEFP